MERDAGAGNCGRRGEGWVGILPWKYAEAGVWSRGGGRKAAIALSVCACGGHASENIAFAGIGTTRRKGLCQPALSKTRAKLCPVEEWKRSRIKSGRRDELRAGEEKN